MLFCDLTVHMKYTSPITVGMSIFHVLLLNPFAHRIYMCM